MAEAIEVREVLERLQTLSIELSEELGMPTNLGTPASEQSMNVGQVGDTLSEASGVRWGDAFVGARRGCAAAASFTTVRRVSPALGTRVNPVGELDDGRVDQLRVLRLGNTSKSRRGTSFCQSICQPSLEGSSAHFIATFSGVGLGVQWTTSTLKPSTFSAHSLPLPW
jgi:hypothetical protein